MTEITVEYGPGPAEQVVRTAEELDAVLDQAHANAIAAGQPSVVHIYTTPAIDAPFLALGVGRAEFSYLTYGGTYVAGDLDGGEPAAWYYAGSHGEQPPGMAIPVDVAREAAREFVRTGRRPEGVEWTEG